MTDTKISHFYTSSQFRGEQRAGLWCYEVVVDIKNVDFENSSLCGYFHIKGLTKENPELTTFFEAEIIGSKHSFVTDKWNANAKTDLEHWMQFESFEPMIETFATKCFKYDFSDKDTIFMRWKEQYVVPTREENIKGATIGGFYYICYHKSSGEIEGYYYDTRSER
ncbi:GID complex subunit 4, VID24 [Entomortierella lignicola]|nr:GID complex subunit 4, VID24 [Entomortierella lignicola]